MNAFRWLISALLLAFLALTSGVILDSVTRGRWEVKRLQYLSLRAPLAERRS